MKKTLIVMTILIMIFAVSACFPTGDQVVEETTVADTVHNEDFMLTIVADNSVYKADEPIACYATIEYMGEEPIAIYHADPLLVFSIEGGEYFHGDYARNDVLERTTFENKDEVLPDERRFAFQKSGGWSADDPNADFYEEFYKDKELQLPAGEYTLSTIMEYSTDEDDVVGTMQTLTAVVTVQVK